VGEALASPAFLFFCESGCMMMAFSFIIEIEQVQPFASMTNRATGTCQVPLM
jgi:hypothetical protein